MWQCANVGMSKVLVGGMGQCGECANAIIEGLQFGAGQRDSLYTAINFLIEVVDENETYVFAIDQDIHESLATQQAISLTILVNQ